MKIFSRLLLVAFLTVAAGTVSTVEEIIIYREGVVQAKNIPTEDLPIPIVLPTLADIVLIRGESKIGRVTAIDVRTKMLKIELSGQSALIPIAQIKKVIFRKDAPVYGSNGKLVIRGDDTRSTSSGQKIWSELPLSNFKLLNPGHGQAEVRLGSIVNQDELEGIQSVATSSLYVVEEIKFDRSGKMTLKVKPVDR
jgi:hypothetical protein